jgi:hypothetical protein
VLLASGYIAGGTLCGLIIAFFAMLPNAFLNALNMGRHFGRSFDPSLPSDASGSDLTAAFLDSNFAKLLAVGIFFALAAILYMVGRSKSSELADETG